MEFVGATKRKRFQKMSRKKRLRKMRRQQESLPWIAISQDMADELGLTAEQLLDAVAKSEAAGFVEIERGPLGVRVRMTPEAMAMDHGPMIALPRHLVQQAAALKGDELMAFLDEHAFEVPPEVEDPTAN